LTGHLKHLLGDLSNTKIEEIVSKAVDGCGVLPGNQILFTPENGIPDFLTAPLVDRHTRLGIGSRHLDPEGAFGFDAVFKTIEGAFHHQVPRSIQAHR